MFLVSVCASKAISLSQSFPSDEGWPFAKYLGACGRVVAVNYVGEELWSFYNAPWEKRVDLARQLMDIAEQLTNNDFDFALYLLDVSFDNFAVGPRDGKVIIVDAENVLVADKRLIKQSESCRLSSLAHRVAIKSPPTCKKTKKTTLLHTFLTINRF